MTAPSAPCCVDKRSMVDPPSHTTEQVAKLEAELARLRAQLDSERRRTEALLRALPEILFVLDRDGRYLDVLGGADRTLYESATALRGLTLHQFCRAPWPTTS